jgi:hypothetical protein
MMTDLFEISGAIHLHSTFSDGALPIPEIAEIAVRKRLDFLMFSDHNTLEPKRLGMEGWHDSVVVLIGYEINDPDDRNHYLAFRTDQEVEKGLQAAEYVREVKEQGGFGIIAHPAEKRNFSDAYPPYPWTAWDVDGFDGIEIWNQLSEWIEGVTRRNFPYRVLHPLRSIRFPVWETLERWDVLNRYRRVVGIGGIDVHAHRYKLLGLIPLEIYPYKVQFRSIRTHLLLEKPLRTDEGKRPFSEIEEDIFRALFLGRCFIVNHYVGDGRGFRFWAEGDGRRYSMGSRVPTPGELTFHVTLPLPGKIRLLKSGHVLKRQHGSRLEWKAKEAGVYRVEVFRKGRGWIYANPIVVEDPAQRGDES